MVTAELFWLKILFQDLQIPLANSLTLWCDNLGAIALTSNPVFHAQTKHVEVDYHFLHEKVLQKDI